MRTVQAGPVTGLIAQVLLVGALVGLGGVGASGWVAGITCGVIANTALARGLSRTRSVRMRPADWVTLVRATLAVGVAALTAASFDSPAPVTVLVTLAAVALVLDAVDGWVARRTRTAATLGAHFDAEVDAFLILVLSVYVARTTGAWVLAIGAARYVFLVAGWPLCWMRQPLPPRHWRKVVAATQGVVLTVAAAGILSPALTRAVLAAALALLAESFGRDVWWLWRRRADSGPTRTAAVLLTAFAGLLVWGALVAPEHPGAITPSAFARLPLEGVAIVALALLLPASPRRVLAWTVGPLVGLLVVVKVLDFGFFTAFDRPFNPIDDPSYAGIGIETMRASIGHTDAALVVVGAAVVGVALPVLTTLAVLRITRVAARARRRSLAATGAVGSAWLLCWALGTPVASTSAASLVVHEVRAVRAGIRDNAIFARAIRRDRFRNVPADRLLTGLRGRDVLLVFVESYGKVAVQGSSFSPQVDAVLDRGTAQLHAAGFAARTGFLTSSTYGGISWLAHSTMQSGVWVNSQHRYNRLVASDRFTLSDAFKRAGWRTVDDVPSNNRTWQAGASFYHYDKVYDRRNVGYRGPTFDYASMPDQYVMLGLQRFELAKRPRPNLFAEVDLVSSHVPWTRIPRLIGWSAVGDGSIFNHTAVDDTPRAALWSDARRVQAAYGKSIEYSMQVLISFVRRYADPNLVMVVLGDHQPDAIVSGNGASHDVPISVIAHDPKVLRRIAGWGWTAGLRPGPRAPVWPMSAFRDRFLGAFGSS